MTNILIYLLKVILCSGLLYSYYYWVLRDKKFHRFNRIYLLSSVIFSSVIPLLKIGIWSPAPVQPLIIQMLAVSGAPLPEPQVLPVTSATSALNVDTIFLIIFCFISFLFALRLVLAIAKIVRLAVTSPQQRWSGLTIVLTPAQNAPFSFFNYIFWNPQTDINSQEGQCILRHELAHVRELHSADKLFINLVLLAGWSNPVFWFIRKELDLIHEFIADEKAVAAGGPSDLARMLLQATFSGNHFSITNSFFYSPVKRRLLMLSQSGSQTFSTVRKWLVLPLLVAAGCFFAFTVKDGSTGEPYHLNKTYTVVIDPGHGGSDNGAMSSDGLAEKDLVLHLAKKIEELNENKNVHIILSRLEDALLTPQQRVAFAEEKKADLFLSLHLNATSAIPGTTNINSGPEIYLPRYNDTFIKESTVLGSLLSANVADLFGTTAPLKQKRTSIWVLKANTICPSALLESGYITNQQDVTRMQDPASETQLAQKILLTIDQFLQYREQSSEGTFPGTILPVEVEPAPDAARDVIQRSVEIWKAKKDFATPPVYYLKYVSNRKDGC